MNGITDLNSLLTNMNPTLVPGEFVFVTQAAGKYGDGADLGPIGSFMEPEGLTLILPKANADDANRSYDGTFRLITLQVHSSLEAVGLTAAVSNALLEHGISANVVAAFFHDHIFVPSAQAQDAVAALNELVGE